MSIRAIYTASQALNSKGTQFSSISENIANLNTTGYKSSSVHFSEMVSGQHNRVNPAGYNGGANAGASTHLASLGGNKATTTRNYMGDGQFVRTGGEFDMAIKGSGQFLVREYTGEDLSQPGETYLTAAGNFQLLPYYSNGVQTVENEGIYLADQNGYHVLGYAYDETTGEFSNASTIDGLEQIKVNKAVSQEAVPAIATTAISFNGNLSSDTSEGAEIVLGANIYTGNSVINETQDGADPAIIDTVPLSLTLTKVDNNIWSFVIVNSNTFRDDIIETLPNDQLPYGDSQPVALLRTAEVQKELGWRIQFDGSGKPLRAWTGGGNFPPAGAEVITDFTNFNIPATMTAPNPLQMTPDPLNEGAFIRNDNAPKYLEQEMELAVDVNSLVSFGGETTITATPNGRTVTVREFRKMGAESDGVVYRYFNDGSKVPLAKIAAGVARSVNGLQAESGTLASIGDKSGEITLLPLGVANGAELMVGSLEQSDVDLAESFANMIVNQRAYGVNTKALTTAVEMHERAIQLKK